MLAYRVTTYPQALEPTLAQVKIVAKRNGSIAFVVPNDHGQGKTVFWEPMNGPFTSYTDTKEEARDMLVADAERRVMQARIELQKANAYLASVKHLFNTEV